jgi:hypothetical protein
MKNKKLFFTVTVLCCLTFPAFAQQTLHKPTIDDQRSTNVGNIGLTLTNYGTFGDGWVVQTPTDFPSCEYPLGSKIEHLFVGGLWIGGRRDDGTILVTTAAVDVASLLPGQANAGFEFTTSANPSDVLRQRSSLLESPFYSPAAISHQDFIADFTDSNLVIPGTSNRIPEHNPLPVIVHLEAYAWNFPFADAFVIFNYTIKNTGKKRLNEVYAGLFGDLVVRNVELTPPRGSAFYQHKAAGYIDSLNMNYAYDYDGNPGFTDNGLYVAYRLLGATPQANDKLYRKRTRYAAWQFRNFSNPSEIFFSPQDDIGRYELMRSMLSAEGLSVVNRRPGNYIELLSTGPFQFLEPDSSLNVVFAVVCAGKNGNEPNNADTELMRRNLYSNADWAQRAYDGEDKNRNGILDPEEDLIRNGKLDRYVLPTPPSPPRFRVMPANQKVTLYWDRSAEDSRDLITGEKDFEGYRLYRSQLGADLPGKDLLSSMTRIAEFDSINGIGYNTGFRAIRNETLLTEKDPVTGEERQVPYHYRFEIDGILNGWQHAFAVTAFDRGNPEENLGSLESSRLTTVRRVFPGTLPQASTKAGKLSVSVYPNPYRARAAWDGHLERDRKLYFINLPSRCEVRIYTLAGDLVDSFRHESATYAGADIQWFEKFAAAGKSVFFSGGEHGWDLVSSDDQAIATGLYLYTVEDLETGEIQKGKFAVIK